jgi:hypothetical protein
MVLKHEQQIKDLAAHLLELKQLVTPMMEFKQPTKIFGPNLEETLNAAGFYRKKDWVGLTDDEVVRIKLDGRDLEFVSMTALHRFARDIEANLKEKHNGR